MNQYIVYQLIDPRNSSPYYIGFAKNPERPYSHLKQYKKWINGGKIKKPNYFKLARIQDIIAAGHQYITEIVFSSNNSDDAYAMEVELIAKYGRLDLATGILTNMSAGGKGFINPSDEMRERLRQASTKPLKDRLSPESFAKWQQKTAENLANPDHIENLRQAGKKGIQHVMDHGWTKEAIEKRVRTRKNRDNYSTNMSACHTKEAIAKRVSSRRLGVGFSTDTAALHTDAVRFKRERTKIKAVILRIEDYYKESFTFALLSRAQKARVTYMKESSVRRYLTEDELSSYSTNVP